MIEQNHEGSSAVDWDDVLRTLQSETPCGCGRWSGQWCRYVGPKSSMVTVEFMPEYLRASHEAAGNAGDYPRNGAERVMVSRTCARWMVEHDPEWVRVVESRS